MSSVTTQGIFVCIILNVFQSGALADTDRATLMYTLVSVDYNWGSDQMKQEALTDENYFIVENNIITGIKVFGNDIFVTVPRWQKGVPATLNRLVTTTTTTGYDVRLQPYPSWDMNAIGDCSALQYVQSMEIDPNTGFMWIIDTGRVNTRSTASEDLCLPKIVILNMATMTVVRKYEFPPEISSPNSNFLNDIVLDYVDGEARYAYITDTSDAKLYVYDFNANAAYYYQHNSMNKKPLISGIQDGLPSGAIDGIAISSDFRYVYYSTVPGVALYAIPTSVLRRKTSNAEFAASLTFVGNKTGGSDGLAYGQDTLFYGVVERNAVYSAEANPEGVISLTKQTRIISDTERAIWVDTFAFNGTDLWFVANKLNLFFNKRLNFTGTEPNMFIWKVDVGQEGYLSGAKLRTQVSGSSAMKGNLIVTLACMLVINMAFY